MAVNSYLCNSYRNAMTRKGRNKAFWNNIKFRYKLTITNESTLEEVAGIRISKLNAIYILLAAAILLFSIAAAIIAFTPLKNYLPGYMNSEVRSQIVRNALRADSLQQALDRQNLYIVNIQDIFKGEIMADTVHSIDSLTNLRADSLMPPTDREKEFRKRYEETEKYNLLSTNKDPSLEGIFLHTPSYGGITTHFNPETRHYGVDIATSPDENILAVLDGTVIISSYTPANGYLIAIQHGQDLVTIYKHCGPLLKNEGDEVKGGEAIALGNRIKQPDPHPFLHLELWKRGRPINPEEYIIF